MTNKQQYYFGTDGIRGPVGKAPITPDFMLKLGWAAGRVFAREQRSKVLIGKDTRISGYMFESALQAGLSAAGVDVHLLGPMPTPAIAYLTRAFRAQAGIVISASHNPYYDNGVKFFSGDGMKLPDETQAAIEAQLHEPMTIVDSAHLGKAARVNDAVGRYVEFCKATVPFDTVLTGLKIVVDCANGATYHTVPDVLSELGATVIEIGTRPDGLNINAGCGSTHLDALKARVVAEKADVGIALDGDGDRVMMIDHRGQTVDGDELVYIIAKYRAQQGKLQGGVVGTLMSNLGQERAFEKLGIPFMRSPVGDRYVMAMLREQGWQLGGESSGHIICLWANTTGDGTVAALQVLALMQQEGASLRDLCAGMEKVPQRLENIAVEAPAAVMQHEKVQAAIKLAEADTVLRGRVLVRPSGTEPLLRVMVEGENEDRLNELLQHITGTVQTVAAS